MRSDREEHIHDYPDHQTAVFYLHKPECFTIVQHTHTNTHTINVLYICLDAIASL